MGVPRFTFFATQNTQRLLHDEERCKADKYAQPEKEWEKRQQDQSKAEALRWALVAHPIKMFRFSSTMTKCTPPSWCSPMNECGTRCRKTSERSPPVCTFVRYRYTQRALCEQSGKLTYSEGSHRVKGIGVDLRRNKREDEVGYAACMDRVR